MHDADKPGPIRSRQDKKLERLARTIRSATELSDRVSGTVEATADLFASEYRPSSEWGGDPRPEGSV
jgi:hypothetical protein